MTVSSDNLVVIEDMQKKFCKKFVEQTKDEARLLKKNI